MAVIEIVYISGYRCGLNCLDHDSDTKCNENHQCDNSGERTCGCFNGDEDGVCIHLENMITRRGWSGKNYAIHPLLSDETMAVELDDEYYSDCVKVVFNGKCIFNRFDDQEEDT